MTQYFILDLCCAYVISTKLSGYMLNFSWFQVYENAMGSKFLLKYAYLVLVTEKQDKEKLLTTQMLLHNSVRTLLLRG